MKHIQFTYVDAITGVPVTQAPAANGPVFPAVKGLQFVWARESEYPTPTPSFFGTCDDDADLSAPGVLMAWSQEDFENLQADEMRRRNAVPQSVSRFQARMALRQAGLFDAVEAMMAHPDTPIIAVEAWQTAQEFRRISPTIAAMAQALSLTEQQLDDLFMAAGGIEA